MDGQNNGKAPFIQLCNKVGVVKASIPPGSQQQIGWAYTELSGPIVCQYGSFSPTYNDITLGRPFLTRFARVLPVCALLPHLNCVKMQHVKCFEFSKAHRTGTT